MNGRLCPITDNLVRDTTLFWSDATRGRVLATLQDRVQQVVAFLEFCKSALSLVNKALFPLNKQPQSLAALMTKFRGGQAMEEFVREQLIGGATFALAIVHVHHSFWTWPR